MTQIRRSANERGAMLSDHEAFQLMMAVDRTKKIAGDIAEVGTFMGGSAKLIAEARGNESKKTIYLFDTFEGLPQTQHIDDDHFAKGEFYAGYEGVKDYLKEYPRLELHKGLFPDSAGPILHKHFSFVHLDVDLYESTKQSLEFFYPRMERGGVIISHDYMDRPGVRKAVDEFMADKPEPVLESSWRQCLIVKL